MLVLVSWTIPYTLTELFPVKEQKVKTFSQNFGQLFARTSRILIKTSDITDFYLISQIKSIRPFRFINECV